METSVMSLPTLTLISFASQSNCLDVSNNLLRLGYTVDLLDARSAHARYISRLKGILVFLFGSGGTHKGDMVSLLAHAKTKPRFGIFIEDGTAWDADIIGRCNEFTSWPCADSEITFRLERLSDCLRPRSLDTGLAEQLMQLNIVGCSSAFENAVNRIRKFALCDAPVLIEGETGTGKELAARAIHYLGPRRRFPFIPVNCGALPESLIENELFGHERGAYTDAKSIQTGLVAQADGGTLFLDEVEALSLKSQATLLRFLQEQEYRPLGGTRVKRADARIIAASNSPLDIRSTSGTFRWDLLYRLNIMPLIMPPLREREGDVDLLVEHFLISYHLQYNDERKFISPQGMEGLRRYDWPGNVRELENLLHREFLLAEGDEIHIPLPHAGKCTALDSSAITHDQSIGFNEAKARAIEHFERTYLVKIMREMRGNVTMAARRAGKERRALGKLLKKHAIDKRDFI